MRRTVILVAALTGLGTALPVPARAELFEGSLLVAGRSGSVDVLKGVVRVEWSLPALDLGRRPWQLLVGTRALTCGDDAAALVAGAQTTFTGRRGHVDLDFSGPDFHVGAHYFVRACMALGYGRYHATNQVEATLTVPVAVDRIIARPPGSPQITGTIAARPVRPRYWIGVTGRDFGERPGQLLLQVGPGTWPLTDLDWHDRAVAGRVPDIEGLRDGAASLTVERADGARSYASSVNFAARREVRFVPGGEVHMDQCSDEADTNTCHNSSGYRGASFGGLHNSIFTTGEGGTDVFSIALVNGWRFHSLEFSLGEAGMPVPTWALRGDPTSPSIQIHWENPAGWGVYHRYGYRLFIVGPAGVPYR